MMLVQKQPNFSLNSSPSTFHHRRHPSAPPAVVVVQPTRTPGLLSLSKPQPHRQQPQQRSPRPAPAQRSTPKLQLSVGPAPATPSPASRGRQAKDKGASTTRSDSLSARRPAHRQSSPPLQAEDPLNSTPTKSNHVLVSNSDPFLVSATSPTLSTRPSGKLARRRQHQPPQQLPNSTQPVSIPTLNKQPPKPLSRSVPLPRHRPARRTFNPNPSGLLPAFDFPICDDMTDAGDLSDVDHAPPSPVTPTLRRGHHGHTHSKPPPFMPPAVANKHTRPGRSHRRAPSDSGMLFHMSSDESGPESTASEEELLRNILKDLAVNRKDMKTPPPQAQMETMYEAQAQAQAHGYFASSVFQNSPSPEELPDPPLF
ncbi:hypothetical protein D9615_006013 [Tricholomella constricta]|uniref:Uncharacterized protein n=1 Tax=Tricholomella constricta TaxID=117010 RepID=A0A8H5H9D4_9AGAR|nr:hypothetical protein D9615_006013 [Tricholomella constricta]